MPVRKDLRMLAELGIAECPAPLPAQTGEDKTAEINTAPDEPTYLDACPPHTERLTILDCLEMTEK